MHVAPNTNEQHLISIIHDLLLSQKYDEAVMEGLYPAKHPAPHARRKAKAALRDAGIRMKSIWPRHQGPNAVDFSYWDKDAARYVREFNREQGKSFGKISSSRYPGNPEGSKISLNVYSNGHSGICSSLISGERITLSDVQGFIERVSDSRKVYVR